MVLEYSLSTSGICKIIAARWSPEKSLRCSRLANRARHSLQPYGNLHGRNNIGRSASDQQGGCGCRGRPVGPVPWDGDVISIIGVGDRGRGVLSNQEPCRGDSHRGQNALGMITRSARVR